MSDLTVKELLIAAKEIISDKEKWAQEYYAYNDSGEMIDPTEPEATCFCSVGALRKVIGNDVDIHKLSDAWSLLDKAAPLNNIVYLNDHGTHEEVMAVWDKAIENA